MIENRIDHLKRSAIPDDRFDMGALFEDRYEPSSRLVHARLRFIGKHQIGLEEHLGKLDKVLENQATQTRVLASLLGLLAALAVVGVFWLSK